jgi:hypothetical protein
MSFRGPTGEPSRQITGVLSIAPPFDQVIPLLDEVVTVDAMAATKARDGILAAALSRGVAR